MLKLFRSERTGKPLEGKHILYKAVEPPQNPHRIKQRGDAVPASTVLPSTRKALGGALPGRQVRPALATAWQAPNQTLPTCFAPRACMSSERARQGTARPPATPARSGSRAGLQKPRAPIGTYGYGHHHSWKFTLHKDLISSIKGCIKNR